MQAPLPQTFDIVLIGGGHAHALVLRMWAMKPLAGVRLTVINPGPIAPYTGMLPGAIAGHYARSEMMIDLVRLARFAGARVILDRAVGIDTKARLITVGSGRTLRYDAASIDIGIASDLPDVPGFAEHAASAKPLGAYAQRWEAFLHTAPKAPRVTIIGAGVGGVELALASAYHLRKLDKSPTITVLEKSPSALSALAPASAKTLMAAMAHEGITLRCETTVSEVGAQALTLSDGSILPSDFTLSVAGARPQSWLAKTGLALQDGFVVISPSLQSSDPAIFAVGDCAAMSFAPRPKAGVFAVRQAPVLFENLRILAMGGTRRLRRFAPQRDYLKLISLGSQTALADKFGLRGGGAWLWRLKDRIDRKFMAKFEDYPVMARPTLPADHARGMAEAMGDKPMCGGCGAKVGAEALAQALSVLPTPARPDVLSGRGDDAAVLAVGGARQVITTDHLRAFTNDPHLMARLTAIHSLGDIWAMGAAPQAALAQITLPRLSPALQADMLAEVMAAASAVFRAAGADIVGGHSSVGDELTLGFTVTGLAADAPIPKTGARPGDVILLTKPLGTGTILAAEMAMARLTSRDGPLLGEVWAGCVASMARPLGPAAAILREKATAMTDVTGFGLAGHLWEMVQGAGVAARLELSALPMLPGAEELAAQGVASSLAPANRAALSWLVDAPPGPKGDLLFDPQTCGGLLATVPAHWARPLCLELARMGEFAKIIGTIAEGPPHIFVD
ncbi:MAG: selenide, water dikinase SelD [Rhodobacteraceae bacterium]|nr:selenide, water dikinase SelD [Paracoccaceae bacterium]MCF8513165.1 selenide, water dikinase SelD [Paracoccaceae bacterium]MCF8517409.1 selenide, water dikinase SelD [Paracoccaceae bacterium]